jgi:hypothetical protein
MNDNINIDHYSVVSLTDREEYECQGGSFFVAALIVGGVAAIGAGIYAGYQLATWVLGDEDDGCSCGDTCPCE